MDIFYNSTFVVGLAFVLFVALLAYLGVHKFLGTKLDERAAGIRAELDEAKRREMYHEMQQILSDDGGTVIPMFASYVFALSDKIGHGESFATNWDLDGERWMERWWFA